MDFVQPHLLTQCSKLGQRFGGGEDEAALVCGYGAHLVEPEGVKHFDQAGQPVSERAHAATLRAGLRRLSRVTASTMLESVSSVGAFFLCRRR